MSKICGSEFPIETAKTVSPQKFSLLILAPAESKPITISIPLLKHAI